MKGEEKDELLSTLHQMNLEDPISAFGYFTVDRNVHSLRVYLNY